MASHRPLSWSVGVDSFTRALAEDFDGSSGHDSVSWKLPRMQGSVPEDFGVGVIFGPTSSGKSAWCRELFPDAVREEPEFDPAAAVCSHPGFEGNPLDRLSSVGLNRIWSWLRPARALSNGERSRVLTALSVKSASPPSACVLEDFCADTDELTAESTATSLARLVKRDGIRRLVVVTTKKGVLAHLAPDWVLFAASGRVCTNPLPPDERRARVDISWDALRSFPEEDGTKAVIAGEIDRGTPEGQAASGPRREKVRLAAGADRIATWGRTADTRRLTVEVATDEVTAKVAEAMEVEFEGRTTTELHDFSSARDPGALVTAIVGPSGTGKSSELRRCTDGAALAPLKWDPALAVVSHFGSEGCTPQEAAGLLAAAALPPRAALRPWHVLSSGEQARAEIARRLARGEPVDEFCSGLDARTTEKVCRGVAKYVRETRRTLVVATVNEAVVQWLWPDVVLFSDSGETVRFDGPEPTASQVAAAAAAAAAAVGGRSLARHGSQADGADERQLEELLRPRPWKLAAAPLSREGARLWWQETFHAHHYLTGNLSKNVQAVLIRDTLTGNPVAFESFILLCGKYTQDITYLEHRLVVLPSYQGLGLGPKLSEGIGHFLVANNRVFRGATAHPRLVAARKARSDLWAELPDSGKLMKQSDWKGGDKGGKMRRVWKFMFLGGAGGNQHLLDQKRGQKEKADSDAAAAVPAVVPREGTSEEGEELPTPSPKRHAQERSPETAEKATGCRGRSGPRPGCARYVTPRLTKLYGATAGCPRCDGSTKSGHTAACRQRIRCLVERAPEPAVAAEPAEAARRTNVTTRLTRLYGTTAGCPRCEGSSTGCHTPGCRERIKSLMEASEAVEPPAPASAGASSDGTMEVDTSSLLDRALKRRRTHSDDFIPPVSL